MDEKPREKGIMVRRTQAALAVFFLSGSAFFILWTYLIGSDAVTGRALAFPVAATVACSLTAFILPERIVNHLARFAGWIVFVG